MISNLNAITLYADQNQTVDESTWGHSDYGEAGSGLTGRLRGKKVPKGGQVVFISDSRRFRPHAYVHRHKLHEPKDGLTRQGTIEMHNLMNQVKEMVIDTDHLSEPSETPKKQIFHGKPIACVDHYFFDDKMQEWARVNDFGTIGTTARNYLPKDIPKEHLGDCICLLTAQLILQITS